MPENIFLRTGNLETCELIHHFKFKFLQDEVYVSSQLKKYHSQEEQTKSTKITKLTMCKHIPLAYISVE